MIEADHKRDDVFHYLRDTFIELKDKTTPITNKDKSVLNVINFILKTYFNIQEHKDDQNFIGLFSQLERYIEDLKEDHDKRKFIIEKSIEDRIVYTLYSWVKIQYDISEFHDYLENLKTNRVN